MLQMSKENPNIVPIKCTGTETVNFRRISAFQGKLKRITPENLDKLKTSIIERGFIAPPFIWKSPSGNKLLDGHQRLKALRQLAKEGWEIPDIPVVYIEADTEQDAREKLLHIASQYGDFDQAELDSWLSDLDTGLDETLRLIGITQNKEPRTDDEKKEMIGALLSETFIIPPMSILDTRSGLWQARKKRWKEIVVDNAETREEAKCLPNSIKRPDNQVIQIDGDGVSILDPVLAEIACRWFGLPEGKTFDPFAGDTSFGMVSGALGNEFIGIEIRQEQAAANNTRTQLFGGKVNYYHDDGQNVAQRICRDSQDLLFSCPPYYDLEVYSDLENDASNQESYEEFLHILKTAFTGAVQCLKDNRFAVIVVGDIRDKKTGFYRSFPDDIKRIFQEAGMQLYNELILVNMLGTAAYRARRYMDTRKVAKVHQNVLIFYKEGMATRQQLEREPEDKRYERALVSYKGDPKDIPEHYQEVETGDFDESEDMDM